MELRLEYQILLYRYEYSYLFACSYLSAQFIVFIEGTPHLTPNIHTCPEEEITLNCTVPHGGILQWEVNFISSSISSVKQTFLNTDLLWQTFCVVNNWNYAFAFVLTSTSPLISTMTTNAVRNLEGATVSCKDYQHNLDTVNVHFIKGD